MKFKSAILARLLALFLTTHCSLLTAFAQGWTENYGGVMLQGFYWDSYKDTRWTVLEQQVTDLAGSFDLIWIPQSGYCGSQSMGYDDLWWFNNYNSSFGNEVQLRSMINTFKNNGLGTIADVVINHRRNASNWVDFPKETWNGETYEMLSTDIVSDDDGGETKKWAADNGYSLSSNKDTGEGWGGMRDLDHKSENVQRIVKAYLKFLLTDLGYTGFRYDMVKGYSASYTGMYNADSNPKFSVGEYWDGNTTNVMKWIDGTKSGGKIQSAAFDFPFRYTVRNALRGSSNDSNSKNWKQDPDYKLLSSESLASKAAYRRYSVTFVENHDTEYRSSTAQQDPIRKDTLAANAFLLAMPGTPCVFLKHWQAYKPEIKAMIAARKAAGITNTSTFANFRSNAAYYANTIKVNDENRLLVVVGDEGQVTPSSSQWTKVLSGYHYAYYLANSLETAWADKGSGDFYEPFDVTLTAVSANPNVKLFYTVNGAEPGSRSATRTNYGEGEVESGTTIRIDAKEDVALTVHLVIDGVLSGSIDRLFTYREPEPEPVVVIPDFCTVAEGEVCAFFEAPADWTNTICCWAWTDSPSDNFTWSQRNDWPGVDCEFLGTAPNGNMVWKWTWDGTKQKGSSATQPAKIIFNNTGQPQTENLVFTQAGYYTQDGLFGVVTATAIRPVMFNSPCSTVNSSYYTLQGHRLNGRPIAKGVYIQNGKLVVIK